MTERTRAPMLPPDEPGNRRSVYGPRAVGALLAPVVKPAFRRRSPATAQVAADWAAIVGPALSAVAHPRGLQGGTLTIVCSGPVAMELQHLSGQLIGRINAALGRAAVQRLRFAQDGAPAAPPPPAPPRPSPAMAREAERRTAGLPEGPLRDALSALGRAVLAREDSRKP